MTILFTSPFSMEVLLRSLNQLRQNTQETFYVHDMRDSNADSGMLSFKGVATANNKVGFMRIKRPVEVRDGDILVLRNNLGEDVAHYVFDVSSNLFSLGKYEVYSIVFPGDVAGFGLCGKAATDDLTGRAVPSAGPARAA